MSPLITKASTCINIILVLIINSITVHSQNTGLDLNGYKSHLNFLSHDLLEGRSSGSRGSDLAALYIANQFERYGLLPISEEQGYFQNLHIITNSTNYSTANFIISGKNFQEKIEPYEEVVLQNFQNSESIDIEGELIFVGYGIEAPEYNWNDFAGVDVRGKIVVCLNEHPDFKHPNYKQGHTTYYGHQDYGPKAVFDRGAKGIIIVHEKNTKLPWNIYQRILSKSYYVENIEVTPLPLISHIAGDAFDRALKNIGLSTEILVEKANQKKFTAFPLELNLKTEFSTNTEKFESPNVIGIVPGTENPDEAIIYIAHYDHVGIKKPINGDSICNGAIDNASGVAGLLTLAENFSKHPQKRSIIFLATAAEEKGLLGAKYYVKNPVIPLEKTIVGVNMDMLNFLGIKDSIELTPVANTDAVKTIKEIAKKNNFNLLLSDYDNRFRNFHLDSYSFGLHDVVTFNFGNSQIKGNYLSLSDSEKEKIIEAGGFNYHTPLDEVKPWFRYDGILQELGLARDIGIHYATHGPKPKLNKNNPFAPAKLLWSK